MSGDRQLVCGRCHVRWGYNAIACPYCGNDDRTRIKSMATPDGMYRVAICAPCGRYIKALDTRIEGREQNAVGLTLDGQASEVLPR